jgi:hypothetical protein
MKYVYLYLISVSITIIWLYYEVWRSPLMDKDGNLIEKEKKLSDLFKRRKK